MLATRSRRSSSFELHDVLAAEHEQLAGETGGAFGGEENSLGGIQSLRRRFPARAINIPAWPWMMVSMLLKSCATPAASWPMDSIFCACRNWLSRLNFVGDVFDVTMHDPAGGHGMEGPGKGVPVEFQFVPDLALALGQARAGRSG